MSGPVPAHERLGADHRRQLEREYRLARPAAGGQAAAVLLEKLTPETLLQAIEKHRATICYTSPTAYRAMAPHMAVHDVSSLRTASMRAFAAPLPWFGTTVTS